MDEAEHYSRDERGYLAMLGLLRREIADAAGDEFVQGMVFACWMRQAGKPVQVAQVMRRFHISRSAAYRWLAHWRAGGNVTGSTMVRGIQFARWAVAEPVINCEQIAWTWGITPAMASQWAAAFARAQTAAVG